MHEVDSILHTVPPRNYMGIHAMIKDFPCQAGGMVEYDAPEYTEYTVGSLCLDREAGQNKENVQDPKSEHIAEPQERQKINSYISLVFTITRRIFAIMFHTTTLSTIALYTRLRLTIQGYLSREPRIPASLNPFTTTSFLFCM